MSSEASVEGGEAPGRHGTRLNRPFRAVVAAVEIVLAAAAVAAGIWLWHHGIVRISYPLPDGRMLDSSRLLGSYAGGAVAVVTVGGFLLVDAVRESLLASRARPRRKERREREAWRRSEEEARS